MGDTLDNIICPVCGKTMKKIYLEEAHINVDICLDGCGGIYLDNRELKKIDEEKEDIKEIKEATAGKEFKEENRTERQIKCPVCGHLMVKNYTSRNKSVEIDTCYNCGGVFLDNGELQKIREEYKTEKERIEAFNKYAGSIMNDIMGEFGRKKTFSSMIKGIIKEHKEFK